MAPRSEPNRGFYGQADSQNALSRCVPGDRFSGSRCRPNGSEAAKNVMGMQHPPTTCFEKARTPKKAAHACLFCFTTVTRGTRLPQVNSFGCSRLSLALGGRRNRAVFEGDGDPYEESGFVSNGAGNGIGFGSRCGYAGEGRQGPPPPVAFDPWDIAFGAGITNDYIFRGITQSNHKPSVNAYFEPRYNVTKDFQLYVGLGGASISFPNRAAAEIDAYGGARLTVGQFAFDVGAWGYMYPGGTCQYGGGATTDFAGNPLSLECQANTLVNLQRSQEGRQLLRSLRQGELHLQRQLLDGRQRLLYAELPQQRRRGHLRFDRRQGDCAEHLVRRQRHRHVRVG